MLDNIQTTLHPEANSELDAPITMEELKTAVQNGNKATWEVLKDDLLTILNQMYMDGMLTDVQKD
jgi:hypothetical protein